MDNTLEAIKKKNEELKVNIKVLQALNKDILIGIILGMNNVYERFKDDK